MPAALGRPDMAGRIKCPQVAEKLLAARPERLPLASSEVAQKMKKSCSNLVNVGQI